VEQYRIPMIKFVLIVAFVVSALSGFAQTIYTTDQNIFDLVPDRDSISGLAGSQRIRANFWLNNAYDDPLDVTAALPIRLTVKSNVDDFQITVLNNATSAPPNTVWWTIPALSAGSYRLTANAVFPDDTFPVFDRFLTLTNISSIGLVQPVPTNITINSISVSNTYINGIVGIVISTNAGSPSVTTNTNDVAVINIPPETDPVWSSASNLYYLSSNPSNFLTVETDPIWSAASNLYATTSYVAATFLPLEGGTMGGSIILDDNEILSVNNIAFSGGSSISGGTFDGAWSFNTQPTIPGYLTVTGAASTYLTSTQAASSYYAINNPSNFISSELDPAFTSWLGTNTYPKKDYYVMSFQHGSIATVSGGGQNYFFDFRSDLAAVTTDGQRGFLFSDVARIIGVAVVPRVGGTVATNQLIPAEILLKNKTLSTTNTLIVSPRTNDYMSAFAGPYSTTNVNELINRTNEYVLVLKSPSFAGTTPTTVRTDVALYLERE
jgi:hypothetical protein